MTALTLNRHLATLLGWSNIIETGGALLGTPPPGEYCVRNQCRVPDWAGDWRDCGPLIGAYQVEANVTETAVHAKCKPTFGLGCFQMLGRREKLCAHTSIDAAARQAIVSAVIAKLEASRG